MDGPLISLALPVMNGLPGLRRNVEALQRQRYRNFELIVQDAGSKDGSLEYLAGADLPRIEIVSEPDSGKGQAYNRAFKRCRGQLVVVTACDEWLEPEALETFVAWHKEHPYAAVVYSAMRLWASDTEEWTVFYPPKFDLIKFMQGDICPTMAGFFNKEVLGDDIYLDESLETCPDYEWFIRIGLHFRPSQVVKRTAVLMNAMADRTSQTYRPESFPIFARDRFRILDRFFAQQRNSPLNEYLRDVTVSSMYYWLAEQLYQMAGETREVQQLVLEAVRYHPDSPKVAYLVSRLGGLVRDPVTGEIYRRKQPQPAVPPPAASPVEGVVELTGLHSTREAAARGAETRCEAAVARIRTSPVPWSEAARLPLHLDDKAGDTHWYWLEATVEANSGRVGIGILTADGEIKHEQAIPGGTTTRLVFRVTPGDRALLIRNAAISGASAAELSGARVSGLPIPGAGGLS